MPKLCFKHNYLNHYKAAVKTPRILSFTRATTYGKVHTSISGWRLGRNVGGHRRAVGLVQEQFTEHLDIDTLMISRYETGAILLPPTVVNLIARLLHTTIAELLPEWPLQPIEHAERMNILMSSLSLPNRDWVEGLAEKLVERCQPCKRGCPHTRTTQTPQTVQRKKRI